MSKSLSLKPRMSEKAYAVSRLLNTYVFDVPVSSNKVMVAAAIEAQFGVTVETVKITNIKGKVKKSYQKRNRPVDGQRTGIKKAYVRLKAGDSIGIFDSLEAAEETSKTADSSSSNKEAK